MLSPTDRGSSVSIGGPCDLSMVVRAGGAVLRLVASVPDGGLKAMMPKITLKALQVFKGGATDDNAKLECWCNEDGRIIIQIGEDHQPTQTKVLMHPIDAKILALFVNSCAGD